MFLVGPDLDRVQDLSSALRSDFRWQDSEKTVRLNISHFMVLLRVAPDLIRHETKLFDARLTIQRIEGAFRPMLDATRIRRLLHERHQFRLALCGHKVVEAGAACLVLMVQGHLSDVSVAHLLIASKTGLLAVLPVLGITFTQYARHLVNRWTASIFLGICTFAADAAIHSSHYPGEYTEAALTAVGAFLFSLLISFTPLGKYIDGLAEEFLSHQHPALNS